MISLISNYLVDLRSALEHLIDDYENLNNRITNLSNNLHIYPQEDLPNLERGVLYYDPNGFVKWKM
jgi:hypothetical protein